MSFSEKNDLNKIFQNTPEYINTEYVHKAIIKDEAIYLDEKIRNNSDFEEFINENLVTIITPDTLENIKDKVKKENIRILQSSYENGRVLEADKKIIIDGEEYCVTIKGVGGTNFYRKTGGKNPFMYLNEFEFKDEEKNSLNEIAFYKGGGVYQKEKALHELKISKKLEELGVNSEKVLGIFEIEKILGKNGKYISIKELKKQGILEKIEEPVLLIRAHKTNFRVLDFIMLDEYKRTKSLKPLIEHILEESKEIWGTNNFQEYIEKLFTTILTNRLNITDKFEELNGGFRFDIFRNFSAFGEELDLGTMKLIKNDNLLENPHYYINHYEREIKKIFIGFCHLITSIEKNSEYKLDHEKIAELLYGLIIKYLKENIDNIKKIYKENNWKNWFNYGKNDFNIFINNFIEKLFSSFINYINTHEYEKIIRKKIKKELN